MQFRVYKKKTNKKKKKIATERNNTTVIAIASDELVAKEACYYASCYRMCIKPVYPTQLQNKIDSEHTKNWKFLSNLFDRPEVIPFPTLTSTNINYIIKENSKVNNWK